MIYDIVIVIWSRLDMFRDLLIFIEEKKRVIFMYYSRNLFSML